MPSNETGFVDALPHREVRVQRNKETSAKTCALACQCPSNTLELVFLGHARRRSSQARNPPASQSPSRPGSPRQGTHYPALSSKRKCRKWRKRNGKKCHVWRGLTHTALLNRMESKVFRLINSPPLTDCLDFLSHRRNVAYVSLFSCYVHVDCSSELANCMPPSLPQPCCTGLSTFSYPSLSIFLLQELTSIFILASLTLVNFGTLFLCLFFH